jgi:nicotinate-nucleotide adenylyltransferase
LKIGIYGGTFNPVHLGHLILAQFALAELPLDKVIFIPAANPPHKKSARIADPELRWQMLNLAVADNPAFEVSRIEFDRSGISYTADTLEQLRQSLRVTSKELYLLIGADSLLDLHKWHTPQRIFELSQVAVFPRPAVNLEGVRPDFLAKIIRIKTPLIEISSTLVRQNIKTGRSIRYLVPPAVQNFIEQNQLYLQD